MVKKENKYENHHHYDSGFPDEVIKGFVKLLFAVLVFILLANLANLIIDVGTESQTVYMHCLDVCEERNYLGYQLGEDGLKGSPFVVEHDRADCVKVCSDTYLRIRGVI